MHMNLFDAVWRWCHALSWSSAEHTCHVRHVSLRSCPDPHLWPWCLIILPGFLSMTRRSPGVQGAIFLFLQFFFLPVNPQIMMTSQQRKLSKKKWMGLKSLMGLKINLSYSTNKTKTHTFLSYNVMWCPPGPTVLWSYYDKMWNVMIVCCF